MVAAGVAVDLGSAAEFAGRHHQGVLEHSSLSQVFDQHANGPVVAGHLVVQRALEIAVVVPVSGVETDKAGSRFDQPAAQQRLFAPAGTVFLSGLLVFPVELECGLGLARHQNVDSLLVDLVNAVKHW